MQNTIINTKILYFNYIQPIEYSSFININIPVFWLNLCLRL